MDLNDTITTGKETTDFARIQEKLSSKLQQTDGQSTKSNLDAGMTFSEVSSITKKNLSIVNRLLKNAGLQLLKGKKKQPPALPPRDSELDEISDSRYSGSAASEFERRLVEKMYLNNISSQYDEDSSSSVFDNKSAYSENSKKLGTGKFGNHMFNQEDQRSNATR
jgi:hypothetical protein